jgi:hypothetical protein
MVPHLNLHPLLVDPQVLLGEGMQEVLEEILVVGITALHRRIRVEILVGKVNPGSVHLAQNYNSSQIRRKNIFPPHTTTTFDLFKDIAEQFQS